MIKQIIFLAAILSIATMGMQPMNVDAQSVTNTITINAECGLGTLTAITFGNTDPGSKSTEGTLDLENTGNAYADVEMYGTDWTDDTDPTIIVINGEQTKFATSDLGALADYDTQKIASNSTDAVISMGTIAAATTNSTYWEVDTTLASGQETFVGAASQTLSFTMLC